jgi:predicted amidohydrolase YtcJ
VRIEHGEFSVVNESDLKTLHDPGIIIVQNPMHLNTPLVLSEMNENYIGSVNCLQGIHSYLENDIPFAIGSDGPINPFLNIMMATLHANNPKEAISVEQAVTAYTFGSAYAEFKEKEKGTLTKGKLADLAILAQDIFTIKPNQLPATTSILTIVGGKIVYDKHLLK